MSFVNMQFLCEIGWS